MMKSITCGRGKYHKNLLLLYKDCWFKNCINQLPWLQLGFD